MWKRRIPLETMNFDYMHKNACGNMESPSKPLLRVTSLMFEFACGNVENTFNPFRLTPCYFLNI